MEHPHTAHTAGAFGAAPHVGFHNTPPAMRNYCSDAELLQRAEGSGGSELGQKKHWGTQILLNSWSQTILRDHATEIQKYRNNAAYQCNMFTHAQTKNTHIIFQKSHCTLAWKFWTYLQSCLSKGEEQSGIWLLAQLWAPSTDQASRSPISTSEFCYGSQVTEKSHLWN